MEGELWEAVYRLILEEANKRARRKHVIYTDAWVLGVFSWAVLHDRPVSWACDERNWPDEHRRGRDLPANGTMSERLRTLSVLQLLAAVLDRLAALAPPARTLVRVVDGKPLPVGGYSKDRDAHWGKSAGGGWENGYKMFGVWPTGGVVPECWTLGPLDEPEPHVAREKLVPCLAAAGAGGYLLGDALFDSNPLHEACAPRGIQLVAPRKKPGTGLGHRDHSPARLRSIELLESPAPGDLPSAGRSPFARELYAMRSDIERRLGNLCCFGGQRHPPHRRGRGRRVRRLSDIYNNHVGTDPAGERPVGNALDGIRMEGAGGAFIGETVGMGNVISGNAGNGITLAGHAADGMYVWLNRIGAARSGAASPALGNGIHGVAILGSSDNRVGNGASPANTIAFNGAAGVYVEGDAQRNLIDGERHPLQRRPGHRPRRRPRRAGRHPQRPPRRRHRAQRPQNFPLITFATMAAAGTVVRFTLNSAPSTPYIVTFYHSTTPDPSGHGEGMTWVGSVDVTTDATGTVSAARDLQFNAPVGRFLTATARHNIFGLGGTSEYSPAVQVTAPVASSVAARHFFYNHSAFDGDSIDATEADDAAIAPDKRARLPGEAATFANVTSYTRGLNGIMIDLADLPPAARNLSAQDFAFHSIHPTTGESGTVTLPTTVALRRGAGAGGADRITLVWPDYVPGPSGTRSSVGNAWLEVTVRANANTGLATPDVFYFGNLLGDTGDATNPFRVSALDPSAVKRALNTDSTLAGRADFNRDGRVNALDLSAARANLNRVLAPGALPAPQPQGVLQTVCITHGLL